MTRPSPQEAAQGGGEDGVGVGGGGGVKTTPEPFGEAAHLKFTLACYPASSGYDRSSIRSGWGDAAHMCDAIAADILREGTVRGRVTKEAQRQAAAVKRAGDAIWAMREMLP